MSRIRSIHPGLTTDEAYMAMSMTCKAAWPLLWMQCDDAGVFEWKPLKLRATLFPANAVDMNEVLAEFVSLGCVMAFEVSGARYGGVRNFCRFQRPKLPKLSYPQTDELRKFVAFKSPPGSKFAPVKSGSFGSCGEARTDNEAKLRRISEASSQRKEEGKNSSPEEGISERSVGGRLEPTLREANNVEKMSINGGRAA
ncbi:MAG TPA: hypothetical protein VN623_06595 [Hyphomicrobium sp.]|uniref:hypothetical protein n=1 Tax=Hyphomicrobium sp. TaxID=82 RepID=UPI002BF3F981|nr:hypothetical protein [Hyphomicrobium sp.]HXE01599.1 hypothetical protein [Hyphomicrobium sp.]